jgi:hypothetical protein
MKKLYFLLSTALVCAASFAQQTTTVSGQTYSVNRKSDVRKEEPANKKEIVMEIEATNTAEVNIENTYRRVVIKTWNKPTIKMMTTINYEGVNKLTDDEWFGKLNISAKIVKRGDNASVRIKSGVLSGNTYMYATEASTGTAFFDGEGQSIGTSEGRKRILEITIPAKAKLDIDCKYGEVKIDNNITDAKLILTNANAEMQDVSNLSLRSKYGNILAGDITTADVEMINGKLSAKNIATLDIDSKYSTIEVQDVATASIRSTNDSYEFEEIGSLTGRKSYGNIRIDKLNQSFELEGSNADVKIRKVAATVKNININNKYADIRLPLKELTNYAIDFEGQYNTVYGNFENKKTKSEKSKHSDSDEPETTTTKYANASNCNCSADNNFTAKNGNGGAVIKIVCTNCTVDFK